MQWHSRHHLLSIISAHSFAFNSLPAINTFVKKKKKKKNHEHYPKFLGTVFLFLLFNLNIKGTNVYHMFVRAPESWIPISMINPFHARLIQPTFVLNASMAGLDCTRFVEIEIIALIVDD